MHYFLPHAYHLAQFLAERGEISSIIDIGCGARENLKVFDEKYKIICIDYRSSLEHVRRSIPHADLIEHDLDNGLPDLSEALLKQSIIICSDVIGRLKQPEQLMRALARLSRWAPYVLISTPDRDRARGRLNNEPPTNLAHPMEWNASEFVQFMVDSGFEGVPFYGHTNDTDTQKAKATILTLTGTHAKKPNSIKNNFRVAAIIHAFNEADILPEVIEHLISQGMEVHVFDNWSTDGTWEIISDFRKSGSVVHAERFPDKDMGEYYWKMQLEKTAEYATSLDADWVMHYDADEIRYSPWNGVTLRDAFFRIDELGFNAADFTVIDFRFLEGLPDVESSYQSNLNHFEFGRRTGHFIQVKAWKNNTKIELTRGGGHQAVFQERKIFPLKFLMKHYSLRNSRQANKKVFQDRLPRMKKEQKILGWHTHYDEFLSHGDIKGWRSCDLLPWHPAHFMSEFVVERISGIGLLEEADIPRPG